MCLQRSSVNFFLLRIPKTSRIFGEGGEGSEPSFQGQAHGCGEDVNGHFVRR
jgi:hypothetical protein